MLHSIQAHKENGDSLRKMYPNFNNWIQTRKRLDPISMFTNQYINRILINSNLDNDLPNIPKPTVESIEEPTAVDSTAQSTVESTSEPTVELVTDPLIES